MKRHNCQSTLSAPIAAFTSFQDITAVCKVATHVAQHKQKILRDRTRRRYIKLAGHRALDGRIIRPIPNVPNGK